MSNQEMHGHQSSINHTKRLGCQLTFKIRISLSKDVHKQYVAHDSADRQTSVHIILLQKNTKVLYYNDSAGKEMAVGSGMFSKLVRRSVS